MYRGGDYMNKYLLNMSENANDKMNATYQRNIH